MALSTMPGYGAQVIKNTTGLPRSIDAPLIQPYKPLKGAGSISSGLGGLGGLGGSPSAGTSGSLGGGAIGGPSGGTTTTTVTPLQVYQDQILSDPGAVAAQGIFGATTANLAAARADAIQRAVIQSGWDPSGQLGSSLQSYAGDLTPQTLQQAAANPMSQKAQLDLQLQQANQNQPYDLAASGMGRSGAAAINAGNLQRQYQTASYSGMNDLLNSIYGAANNYAGGYNNAINQLDYARAQVAARLAQNAGYSQTVTTDDGSGGGGGAAGAPAYSAPAQVGGTSAAVQRVIQQLGIKKGSPVNQYLYQNVRNIRAG